MIQDILHRENMVYRNLFNYLKNNEEIVEIVDKFGDAEKFELNPLRPKKVHWFFFWTKDLLNIFNPYKDLFTDYPYFKINITQAKVMPYITYKLKDKELVKTKEYQEFKELYNNKYGEFHEKLMDKKSRNQCYRLKGTVLLDDMKFDEDVSNWMDESFKPVMEIK